MMEFRDAVLDSNPFSSRPSFPSVYTTSSMFAVRPLSTIPTVNEEYGSRSGTKSGYVSVGGSSSINNDVCMGDSDKSAVFSRIHDCLSSTGTRSDPNKLLVCMYVCTVCCSCIFTTVYMYVRLCMYVCGLEIYVQYVYCMYVCMYVCMYLMIYLDN